MMRTPLRQRRGAQTQTPSRWKARLLDLAILVSAGIVCLFVISISSRLSYSLPEKQEAPIIVRVQILNGSGHPAVARKVADHLSRLAVGRMRFDDVDVGNFDRADIKRTFVINRRLDPAQVDAIIAAWGLGPADVSDGRSGVNDLGFDLSIILGENIVDPATVNTTTVSP